ncbi:MAG TPA: hypothetical protein VGR69_03990 [Candidatus Rubrimentiphilum sp.]|nr:hypothetical protein [Candidatus Rubrimentiphilum sp.]
MKQRRIGITGYNGLQALDVAGPADVFTTANALLARKVVPYEVVLLGERTGPITTESGVSLYAGATLAQRYKCKPGCLKHRQLRQSSGRRRVFRAACGLLQQRPRICDHMRALHPRRTATD